MFRINNAARGNLARKQKRRDGIRLRVLHVCRATKRTTRSDMNRGVFLVNISAWVLAVIFMIVLSPFLVLLTWADKGEGKLKRYGTPEGYGTRFRDRT